MSRPVVLSLAIAAAVAVTLVLAFHADDALELPLRDAALRLAPATPAGSTVVVAIDEPSLRAFGRWPWPRTVLADLIDRASALGARGVVLDVLLAEPADGDPRLTQAMSHPHTVTIAALDEHGQWRVPIAPIREVATMAHGNFELDGDGILRRFASTKQSGDRSLAAHLPDPGVTVHAAATESLVRGEIVRTIPPIAAGCLAGGAVAIILLIQKRRVAAASLILLITIGGLLLLDQAGIVIPFFALNATVIIAIGGVEVASSRGTVQELQEGIVEVRSRLRPEPLLVHAGEMTSFGRQEMPMVRPNPDDHRNGGDRRGTNGGPPHGDRPEGQPPQGPPPPPSGKPGHH